MQHNAVRGLELFDGLSDEQLAELVDGGSFESIEPGVDLFVEGEPAVAWWVLVDGAIDLVRHIGRETVVVARMDVPGRWAGGFRAWDAEGTYLATGRGSTPGTVLRVPAEVLRERAQSWFPFAGRLIEGLYRTARSIESTARQRGSLVTLGTLAAGLAHELNNPAAAATRAVDALESASATVLSSLSRLALDRISWQQFVELDRLRQELEPGSGADDPLDRADAEQAMSGWLSRHHVEHEWTLAPALVAAGADVAWCDRVAGALADADPGADSPLQAGLDWVASTVSVRGLLAEVKESTRRVSELVGAVRSYSQMDRASRQRIDLTEGLDSTVVMLSHKLRDGVTVEREYGADVPEVEAYPGELNQVWTNLLDNAVDAMDGRGTLRLTTRLDGADVVVVVADTGAGMSPDVAGRAFEAFFTTKEVGQGTGLGLDIARRIVVERHGGTIDIESEPGRTTVSVRLPVRGIDAPKTSATP
jgi:signal transduction histidine kinase